MSLCWQMLAWHAQDLTGWVFTMTRDEASTQSLFPLPLLPPAFLLLLQLSFSSPGSQAARQPPLPSPSLSGGAQDLSEMGEFKHVFFPSLHPTHLWLADCCKLFSSPEEHCSSKQ